MRHGSSSIAAQAAALALLTGLGFAPAVQALTPFPTCDGYGPPVGHADGMTAEQGSAWLPIQSEGADPDRKIEFGDVGVEACDASLADPALKPAFWARRANLLRARALHNIAAGHYDEALKELDRAEAEIKDRTDPFFRRSVGLSLDFLRAYADHKVGRSQEGVDLALKTWAERPYSREATWSAVVAIGPTATQPEAARLMRRWMALQPKAITPLLVQIFGEDTPQAAAIYAHNGPDLPVKSMAGWLPYPEAAVLALVYHESKKPWPAATNSLADLEADGFRVTPSNRPNTYTVEFRSPKATPSMIEEMALLRAATLAREKGKRGFIITDRHDGSTDLQMVSRGTVVSKSLLTRRSILEIELVDQEALPAGYAGQSWRVLDADEIYATFTPIYFDAPSADLGRPVD